MQEYEDRSIDVHTTVSRLPSLYGRGLLLMSTPICCHGESHVSLSTSALILIWNRCRFENLGGLQEAMLLNMAITPGCVDGGPTCGLKLCPSIRTSARSLDDG